MFLIVTLLALPSPSHAKDYSFPYVSIKADVHEDGSLTIVERRTYAFSGSFSWADLTILKTGATAITDFRLEEDGKPYRLDPSARGEPFTYELADFPDHLYVKWHYKAQDEQRTFTWSYRVVGAVKRFDDVAELYWKFVGSDWNKPVGAAEILVVLPPGASRDEIRAFAHGPLHGVITIENGQLVRLSISPLPAHRFVEGRILFPTRLVPHAPYVPGNRLATVLAEEKAMAEAANRERRAARLSFVGAAALVFALLALYLFLFRRYGREYMPSFQGDFYRELPSSAPPALVGYLSRFGRTTTDDITATVMHFALRGLIRIDKETFQKSGILFTVEQETFRLTKLKEIEEDAPDFERTLFNFLFYLVGDGTQCTLAHVEEYCRKHPAEAQSFWTNFQHLVREAADRRSYIEPHGRVAAILYAVLCVATGLGSFAYGITTGQIAFALAMFPCLLLALLSFFLQRRSREAAEEFARWKAFKRFLVAFSNLKEAPPGAIVLWDHYLVYAIPLGVAKKAIEKLEALRIQSVPTEATATFPYGSIGHGVSSSFASSASFSSFTAAFSSSFATALSPISSGTGAGGGFSGEGGGGGGGGGGGAG